MKRIIVAVGLFCMLIDPWHAFAEQLKVHVAGFAIAGAEKQEELKTALQSMLMSRLNGEQIITSDSPTGADITVTGNYTRFGKLFSIDAAAKDSSGKVIFRTFVQGGESDELIAAVGKLSQQLASGITAKGTAASVTPDLIVPPAAATPRLKEDRPAAHGRGVTVEQPQPIGDSQDYTQRIPGVMRGIALGKREAGGERHLIIAGEQMLQLYRQGKELQLLAEVKLATDEKILAVDTADLDGDGNSEIYVTVWNGTSLVSQVWLESGQGLEKVAGKLPYYLRAISIGGGEKKVYAQQINSGNDFYGDVYELVKDGKGYRIQNPLKLPRFGTLFNFNMFKDRKGINYFVVTSPDGNLVVYNQKREKVWQSSEKYGGSETYFLREDYTYAKATGETKRYIFLDQRISVTRKGEIVVPQNVGFWNFGNSRSFSKNSLVCLEWNGSSLKVKWRGEVSENYLADYVLDEARDEAVLIEVVDRAGVVSAGASAVSSQQLK